MQKISNIFDEKKFLKSFQQKISQIQVDHSRSSVSKELLKNRSEWYQNYLENSFLEDDQDQLVKFYQKFEKPSEIFIDKFLEINCINNFNLNASLRINQIMKGSNYGKRASAEVLLIFYEKIKNWMIAAEKFKDILLKMNFYVENISEESISRLLQNNSNKINYHLSFKQIIVVIMFKLLRLIIKNARKFVPNAMFGQFFVTILIFLLSLVFGVKNNKMMRMLNNFVALGFMPLYAIADAINPLNLADDIDGYFHEKENNVFVEAMNLELEKSIRFLENATTRFRDCLSKYTQMRSCCDFETQGAMDQRILMSRFIEVMIKGGKFDMDLYETFVESSDIKFIELGNGWVELEDDEKSEMESSKIEKK